MMTVKSAVSIDSGLVRQLGFRKILNACMPIQGCVEIQNDAHGKIHDWHHHDTDETLVILDGAILFFWEGGEALCKKGDVIRLPKGVRHGSRAIDGKVRYLISFHSVAFPS